MRRSSRSPARRLPRLAAILLTGFAALAVHGVERFGEGFEPPAGWTFGPPNERIEAPQGNPGSYLHIPAIDTIAPQPRTAAGVASAFTGDFRLRQVRGVGVDVIVHETDFGADGRPLSLLLTDDNDTPEDPLDDCSVFFVGESLIPLDGEGWKSFTFFVGSGSATLPAGWDVLSGPCNGEDEDVVWNRVITDVDALSFFFGDPTLFYIFQVWDVGIDNPVVLTLGE